MELSAAFEVAAKVLPDGWTVSLTAERGSAWVTLTDPKDEQYSIDPEDEPLPNQVRRAVDMALNLSGQAGVPDARSWKRPLYLLSHRAETARVTARALALPRKDWVYARQPWVLEGCAPESTLVLCYGYWFHHLHQHTIDLAKARGMDVREAFLP